MINLSKLTLSLLALPALLLASTSASAYTTPPECGAFNFDENSAGCEIRVKASCSVDCSSLNFVAGCDGGCVAKPTPGCKDNCGPPCVAECDPSKLDCITGCHDECEQPFISDCQKAHPERDCANDAKASCTGYCRDQCKVQPSNCLEHCDTCCAGACTSLSNMECDLSCYAKLEGSCKAQCDAPSGALFCNGQYVGASDVDACINALLAQGLQVNAEAKGEVKCDLNGCDALGSANVGGLGCSASPAPGSESPFAAMALAVGIAGAGISAARRRSRKNG
jgi:hypothetical protein